MLDLDLLDLPTLSFNESDISNSEEWLREGSSISGGSEKLRLYARGGCSSPTPPESAVSTPVERKKIPLPKPTLQKKRRGKRGKKTPSDTTSQSLSSSHSWNREFSTSSEEISEIGFVRDLSFRIPLPETGVQSKNRIPLPSPNTPVSVANTVPLPKAGRIPLPSQMSVFYNTGRDIKTGLSAKS